jgi:xanthine dehydrogenase accessory factor
MYEIWHEVERWQSAGSLVAVATVIRAEGSSPRPLASKMAVTPRGEIAGSVSGGCVEGAVYEEAQAVIRSGQPRRLSYGIPDSLAWSVGLACGGSIQVYVESLEAAPWRNLETDIRRCLAEGRLAALATVVAGPGVGNKLMLWPDGRRSGDLGSPVINEQAAGSVAQCWHTHSPILASYPHEQTTVEVFIDVFAPLPRLVVIGAVHIAIPLVTIARAMNFRTIVIDARSAFATRERFPHADELIVEWPSDALEKLHIDPSTYIVCLSHDEKLDNPALQVALASPARYVGALGSRKTHANRLASLREMGLSEESLARIHAPIGLDLGAKYPEEIALSIMAEIIAERHGVSVNHRGL